MGTDRARGVAARKHEGGELMAIGRCKYCKAAVYWLKNNNTGKSMPVDVSPKPDGNVFANFGDETQQVLGGDDLLSARAEGVELRHSHMETCTKKPAKSRPQAA
jgi:hypothetical protein